MNDSYEKNTCNIIQIRIDEVCDYCTLLITFPKHNQDIRKSIYKKGNLICLYRGFCPLSKGFITFVVLSHHTAHVNINEGMRQKITE